MLDREPRLEKAVLSLGPLRQKLNRITVALRNDTLSSQTLPPTLIHDDDVRRLCSGRSFGSISTIRADWRWPT